MLTRAGLISALATADPAERILIDARHQKFWAWVDDESQKYERVIEGVEERILYDRFRSAWQEYTDFETPLLAAPYSNRDAIRVLSCQCLSRRVADKETLTKEVAA